VSSSSTDRSKYVGFVEEFAVNTSLPGVPTIGTHLARRGISRSLCMEENKLFFALLSVLTRLRFHEVEASTTTSPVILLVAESWTVSGKSFPTLPGVPRVILARSRVARWFWIVVCLSCTTMFLFGVTDLLHTYFSYPKKVNSRRRSWNYMYINSLEYNLHCHRCH